HFGPVPEDGPVKPKTLGLVAALVALPTAAAVIPGRLAGATAPAQRAGASSSQTAKGGTATLVSVTVTTARDDPGSADRDGMRSPARRLRAAGCTNPGAGTSAYSLSGSRVNGPTTAHLNPAGGPGGAASALPAAFSTRSAPKPAA